MKWEPTKLYLVDFSTAEPDLWVMEVSPDGKETLDIFFKSSPNDKWTQDEDVDDDLWRPIDYPMLENRVRILKQWDSRQEMMEDMFVELL